jgi:hypothetical protein
MIFLSTRAKEVFKTKPTMVTANGISPRIREFELLSRFRMTLGGAEV